MSFSHFAGHRPGSAKVYYLSNETGELDPVVTLQTPIVRYEEEFSHLRDMVIKSGLPLPIRIDFISTHLQEIFPDPQEPHGPGLGHKTQN